MHSTDTNVIQFYLLAEYILVHAYLDIFTKRTCEDIQQCEMLGLHLSNVLVYCYWLTPHPTKPTM